MTEIIEKCYVCGFWFLMASLQEVHVPDQGGGHVTKHICQPCLANVKARSGPEVQGTAGKPGLLME